MLHIPATQTLHDALAEACKQNDVAEARRLLALGVQVGSDDSCSLLNAAKQGNDALVTLRLAQGHEADETTHSCTPLQWAAENGHCRVIRLLVENGADIHAHCILDWEPVQLAVSEGHLDALKLLLELGSDVNCEDEDGWIPLHCAAWNGAAEVVRMLLEHGADPHAVCAGEFGKEHCTPIDIAEETNHSHVAARLRAWAANTPLTHMTTQDTNNTPPLAGDKPAQPTEDRVLYSFGPLTGKDWLSCHLLNAAAAGETDTMLRLLEQGANVNYRYDLRTTPLLEAAWHGQLDAARMLLAHGADIHACNHNGFNALMAALSRGHVELARYLLSQGAAGDSTWLLALCAPLAGMEDVAARLLQSGARANACNPYCSKASILSIAARHGQLAITRLLLEHGAEVDKPGHFRETPLLAALMKGHRELVRLLLEHGAAPHSQDDCYGDTPLRAAVERGFTDIVATLLERGADANAPGRHGRTPLFVALADGREDMVRLLLQHGATPGREEFARLIRVATHRNRLELLRLILEHTPQAGVWLMADEELIFTLAERLGRTEIATLLRAEADKAVAALHEAVRLGQVHEVRALLESGAKADAVLKEEFSKKTPLCTAASKGNIEMMRLLLSHGADPNQRDYDGICVFDYALTPDNATEALALLFENGLPVDARDEVGTTPLMLTALCGEEHIARYLLECGADIEAEDADRQTPLMYAVEWESEEVMQLLLNCGADVHARDFRGQTVMHYAMQVHEMDMAELLYGGEQPQYCFRGGHEYLENAEDPDYVLPAVRLLRQYGAEVDIADKYGWTPLLLALACGNIPAAELLQSYGATLRGVNENALGRARRFAEHNGFREAVEWMDKQLKI